jgi:DNA-binding transcriptional LysR family regulator
MASGAGTEDRPSRKPARPIGLQVKHLEALMAIAVEGSFGGAARRLGYTQSAVSQQIAALERLVGQRLVERSKTAESPRLTPTGRLLLTHAETIMSVVYAAEADLVAARRAPCLRLGALRSLAGLLFPPALKRFRDAFPNEDIEFLERASSDELLELVEGGAIDAAFAVPPQNGWFDVQPVLVQHYVAAVPAEWDIARLGEPLSLRQLRELPLVGGGREALLQDAELQARRLPELEVATLLAFVRAGVGIALVPELAFDTGDESIVALPVAAPIAPQQIALVTHRQRRTQLPLEWLRDLAQTSGRTLKGPRRVGRPSRQAARQGTVAPRLQLQP